MVCRSLVIATLFAHAHSDDGAKAHPEAPENFAQELDITGALDPIFNGKYVVLPEDAVEDVDGFPVYGHVTLGSSNQFSKFIYPARMSVRCRTERPIVDSGMLRTEPCTTFSTPTKTPPTVSMEVVGLFVAS